MTSARRSRDSEPTLTVIYWRDIPAQVKARAGRERASWVLPERFMVAVDAAATKAGKTDIDDYVAEWREVGSVCGPDLDTEVQAAAARLDSEYPQDRLRRLVQNEGWAADPT